MEYEYNDKRRFVKYKTAAKRYDVCLPTLEKWAKEAPRSNASGSLSENTSLTDRRQPCSSVPASG